MATLRNSFVKIDARLNFNEHKREQSAELAADVAVWLAKGNKIQTVDHTANAGYQLEQRRLGGLSVRESRAEITKQNGGFFKWDKKGARK